ncbi:low affinity immunoglobulin epsilon Fc receptor-like [Ruditapes philippinarum]|uniref:low affinity immunoglobulin epsilon Fc receptor-like n=1 Tax=Ruditapes philippinarum TaxID=129788 RepID=UPI00295AABD8|nr:low affinity immunoglobulin epsilon Fc receptor-like [Ruditapes philippinarum]
MEIKLMLAIVFLCTAVISATAGSNRSLEVNLQSLLQSVGNHIDNIESQISNLKDFDKDTGSRLAMNTNETNILRDAQSTNMKRYQETSNKCIEKTDSLTQKYEILLKKYEALETKISKLNQCPTSWFPYMNSCYILKKEAADWYQAQEWCQKNEAKLVEYSDMDEVTFVLSKAKADHYWDTSNWVGFWVGANDLQKEGVFKWSTSRIRVHLENWLPGQPDKISSEEDCMQTLVNQQGKWNDAPCDRKLNFMCEK